MEIEKKVLKHCWTRKPSLRLFIPLQTNPENRKIIGIKTVIIIVLLLGEGGDSSNSTNANQFAASSSSQNLEFAGIMGSHPSAHAQNSLNN